MRSGGHGASKLLSRSNVVLSYSRGDRPCHTKSVFRLGKVCLGPRSYVLSWEEYLGFRGHFVGEESVFLRDVLAQKLVAELTVDPGESEHTPGQYLGCGLSIVFCFPEISNRICRHDSRIQPRHWKEQRREMRKKREKKEKRATFVTYACRGILCLQFVEL